MSVSPCIGDAAAEYLLTQRKCWLRQNEDMKAFQKLCAQSGDRDGARFFKDEAAYAMKFYRAACLLIPHVAAEFPGDCVQRDPYDFPPELFPYLVHLENMSGCCDPTDKT
jgi:hypothetical protein